MGQRGGIADGFGAFAPAIQNAQNHGFRMGHRGLHCCFGPFTTPLRGARQLH